MKSSAPASVATIVGLVLLSTFLVAQNYPSNVRQKHYQVVALGTLGGTISGASSINNAGWITGSSDLDGNLIQHATLWTPQHTVDLGTLGGPNSAVGWPNHNDHGKIAGFAETPDLDPLNEGWSCSHFFPQPPTGHVCLGFVWQNNGRHGLPTLGGTNGYVTAMNNHDQVVGWAENTVHDSTCTLPQVLQFEAVVWGPNPGDMQQLQPYPGDPDTAATAINDLGQVVGISGLCDIAFGGSSAIHPVLWDKGSVTYLGSFGGSVFNTAAGINNAGTVVGWSDLTGDAVFHAFVWTQNSGMIDIGTLDGDSYSLAYAINDRGQVVGQSLDANFNSRAFLYENGKMYDLNKLVTPGSPTLTYANDINSSGQITGGACTTCTGESIAFLAAPEQQGDVSSLVGASETTRKGVLPERIRQMIQQRHVMGRLN